MNTLKKDIKVQYLYNKLSNWFLFRYEKSLSILLEKGDAEFEKEMKSLMNIPDHLRNTPLHYATTRGILKIQNVQPDGFSCSVITQQEV